MQSSLLPRPVYAAPVSPPAQAEARSDTARCEAEARARRAEGRVAALEAKVRALESKVAPAAASAAAARPRELLDPAASSDMVRGLMAELAEQVRRPPKGGGAGGGSWALPLATARRALVLQTPPLKITR